MCFTYTKDGEPSYVRCCYRTGRPGVHVPIDKVIYTPNGHVSRETFKQPGATNWPRGKTCSGRPQKRRLGRDRYDRSSQR